MINEINIVGNNQLREMLEAISGGNLGKIINKSIYPAAATLKAETADALRRLPNGARFFSPNSKKSHWGVASDGIRIGKPSGYYGYHVNIMGDPRLWWAEGGTVIRSNQNGANRGAAPARPFFNPTYDANKHSLEQIIQQCFEKNIKEAWEKKR